MDARSLYTPSAWQTEFHNLPHREALGAGAAGPGKTTCLQWEPLAQIVTEHQRCADKNHPHHIEWGSSTGWVLYLRRQMPMLEQQMNRAIQAYKRIDPNFEWRAGTNTGVFKSGLHIQFGHCNDISDFERYMSLEVTMVIFDELRQFERVQYENIVGRLRSTDPVLRNMLKARAMSNPTDRDGIKLKEPNWVRDYFVKDAPDGRVTLSRVVKLFDGTTETWDRIYLPAKLSDNPDKDFVRSFETNLRTRPIHIQRALLHGDWFSKPGSFFGEDWDSSVHICKPFQVPTNWRHFRSMDWGFKSHGVVLWWAQDPDGTWFIHRELSFIGMHPDKVAAKIIEIEESMGLARKGKSLITGPADTQLWEQRGDRGLSKAQEMAKMGVRWVKANKSPGSIARNSERLLMLLRDHKEDGVPGIVFFNTCRMCIQTIPEIMPDKDDPNVPDKNYPDDHWLDAARYGTEYSERVGARSTTPDEKDEDIEDDTDDASSGSRGTYGYG